MLHHGGLGKHVLRVSACGKYVPSGVRSMFIQGSMVAEVSAVRKSVDEERQRLFDRCAALDREKRQAEAEAREESDRLAEQVRACSTSSIRRKNKQHEDDWTWVDKPSPYCNVCLPRFSLRVGVA